jgi:hypothetical protein
MNKKTKLILGVGLVALAGYMILKKKPTTKSFNASGKKIKKVKGTINTNARPISNGGCMLTDGALAGTSFANGVWFWTPDNKCFVCRNGRVSPSNVCNNDFVELNEGGFNAATN